YIGASPQQIPGSVALDFAWAVPVAFSQSQIDGLQVGLAGSGQGSAGDLMQRWYALAVDLTYTIPPAVTAFAPTGTITSSARPNAGWTYTPGSEGAQSHYQVRVFEVATVTAAGFDVATSPAVFDSGPSAGAVTAVPIDGLRNNTSYRSYVRVAQIVNGQPNWSQAWSSTDFAISMTTAAPVVSAPTGVVTTTTAPVVTWAHQGTYGPQADYQVRVFTAAQYGIAGFDPAVSPATYDSGVQIGLTSTLIVSLINALTYRAYVRTAQQIVSDLQWSPYAFTAFSLNAATAEVASVSATADNVNARTRITVTRNLATPNWATIDVQRSHDLGVTWEFVRGATGVVPPGDVWIGYDYEAGNAEPVMYRAHATYSLGTPITGAWQQSLATVSWSTPGVDWLKDLRRPSLSLRVHVETLPALVRERPRGVFSVVGRPEPVIITDVQHLSTGDLTVITLTDDEAVALEALLAADVLLFQAGPGDRFGSRYLSIGTVTEVRLGINTDPVRQWLLPFVEVASPADFDVIIIGLTWADIIATYATWTTLGAGVATWGDLI
ncbi:MAG: hypothetical protein ABI862_17750, partial [Ilumatobacteraceae bacterium]